MIDIKTNYSLLKHNTFNIDYSCAYFLEYSSKEEIIEYIKSNELKHPVMHIGEGSNLLLTRNFPGTVLHSKINFIEINAESRLSANLKIGAGVNWDEVVKFSIQKGLYGIENLSNIPGETGSAAIQNIGAYGVEIKDYIVKIEAIDLNTGDTRTFLNEDCFFSYRYSIFKDEEMKKYIITSVTLRLSKQPIFNLSYKALNEKFDKNRSSLSLENIRNYVTELRDSKLPDYKVTGNAGSFFTNPIIDKKVLHTILKFYPNISYYPHNEDSVKLSAAYLIDQCGWKGKTHKGAGVYEKQALVLINTGSSDGKDVLELSELICQSVQERFGIKLTYEVNIY